MKVSSNFESGKINVHDVGAHGATLSIPHDAHAPRFRQWFAFDVMGEPGTPFEVVLANARECTWGDALGGVYKVYGSDGSAWRRLDSTMVGGKLVIRGTHAAPRLRVCYYPPYPAQRLAPLRRLVRRSEGRVVQLGKTAAGRSLECLELGRGDGPPIWIIAQQHPGEAMAGWFVEGLVEFLTGGTRLATSLLERASFAIVPRMNPDGAAVGNHRTTPAGVDLNRAWLDPAAPPEVALVRARIKERGAKFFFDVHGDERLPWVFAQPADGLAASPENAKVIRFEQAMLELTPDYQTKHRYPHDPRGKPNLSIASNWVHHEFGCPALTLEMPFSDHVGKPDPRGFFPARARRLGTRVPRGLAATL